jgi:DnaJ-class molecular chaperone
MIRIQPHETLSRQGLDLLAALVLTRDQASAGGVYLVNTPEGEVPIQIPAGTQNGASLKVEGKGFPRIKSGLSPHGKDRGDLIVRVNVR